jgi:hypothetical protein
MTSSIPHFLLDTARTRKVALREELCPLSRFSSSLFYLLPIPEGFTPEAKRGYVSHRQSSIASILKTMYLILGIPYLNLYDAAANDLAEMFTPGPDFTSYRALPVDCASLTRRRSKTRTTRTTARHG